MLSQRNRFIIVVVVAGISISFDNLHLDSAVFEIVGGDSLMVCNAHVTICSCKLVFLCSAMGSARLTEAGFQFLVSWQTFYLQFLGMFHASYFNEPKLVTHCPS